MTCQECQPLAIDLARGLPPFGVGGAVQRADVLSHIATCKRCAQWLREQEALSGALRDAAEADASLAAPPGIEANVMAAWRARHAQRQLSLARPQPVAHAERPEQLARTWRPAWPAGRSVGFAAAASIAIVVLMMSSLRWLHPSPAVNSGANNAASASTAAPPVAGRPGEQAGESAGARVTGTNAAVVEVLPDKATKGTKATKGRLGPPQVMAPRAATARGLDSARTTRASGLARGANEFSGPAFVLLPYVEPLRPTEMRHIMRVRMTRTQLAAAELQAASVDDATVLADVLVGEDGTARAVRIVQ